MSSRLISARMTSTPGKVAAAPFNTSSSYPCTSIFSRFGRWPANDSPTTWSTVVIRYAFAGCRGPAFSVSTEDAVSASCSSTRSRGADPRSVRKTVTPRVPAATLSSSGRIRAWASKHAMRVSGQSWRQSRAKSPRYAPTSKTRSGRNPRLANRPSETEISGSSRRRARYSRTVCLSRANMSRSDRAARPLRVHQLEVRGNVAVDHDALAETLFQDATAMPPVDRRNAVDRVDHLIDRFTDEAVDAVLDHFGYGSALESNHGDAAGQRLRHDDAEQFVPQYRHQHRGRGAEQFVLRAIVHRADVANPIAVDERPHLRLEVLLVLLALREVARKHEPPARPAGDLDREMRALDVFHAPKKDQRRVIVDARLEAVGRLRDAVVDEEPLAVVHGRRRQVR